MKSALIYSIPLLFLSVPALAFPQLSIVTQPTKNEFVQDKQKSSARKKLEEKLKAVKRNAQAKPKDATAQFEFAKVCLELADAERRLGKIPSYMKENARAKSLCEAVIGLDPTAQNAYFWLAEIQSRMGATVRARSDNYNRSYLLEKSNVTGQLSLARMKILQGKPDSAIKAYELVLKKKPNHFLALTGRAHLYFAKANYPSALNDLNSALKTQLDSSDALALKAHCLLAQSKVKESGKI